MLNATTPIISCYSALVCGTTRVPMRKEFQPRRATRHGLRLNAAQQMHLQSRILRHAGAARGARRRVRRGASHCTSTLLSRLSLPQHAQVVSAKILWEMPPRENRRTAERGGAVRRDTTDSTTSVCCNLVSLRSLLRRSTVQPTVRTVVRWGHGWGSLSPSRFSTCTLPPQRHAHKCPCACTLVKLHLLTKQETRCRLHRLPVMHPPVGVLGPTTVDLHVLYVGVSAARSETRLQTTHTLPSC